MLDHAFEALVQHLIDLPRLDGHAVFLRFREQHFLRDQAFERAVAQLVEFFRLPARVNIELHRHRISVLQQFGLQNNLIVHHRNDAI